MRSERLSGLGKVTQLIDGLAGSWIQSFLTPLSTIYIILQFQMALTGIVFLYFKTLPNHISIIFWDLLTYYDFSHQMLNNPAYVELFLLNP